MKNVKKRNIKKDKVLLELNILLYLHDDILSINPNNTNLNTYNKIQLVYYDIKNLFYLLYKYYNKKSLIILEDWYKNRKNKNINLLYCINNFILKYISKSYIFKNKNKNTKYL